MSRETRRFMRLIVFFDLPTTTPAFKRAYALFRHFLIQDGYDMLQWSVYARIIDGQDMADKHLTRLTAHLPEKGSVRCMQVSEKQYVGMKLMVGQATPREKIGREQFLLF